MHRATLLRLTHNMPPRMRALPRVPHALPTQLVRVAQWFHALADVTRLEIIEMLVHRERCVSELQQALDIAQPLLSFHLKVLKQAGLIRQRRHWPWMYYALQFDTLEQIVAFAQAVGPGQYDGSCPLACCQPLRRSPQL